MKVLGERDLIPKATLSMKYSNGCYANKDEQRRVASAFVVHG